jgi:hypothetical protein
LVTAIVGDGLIRPSDAATMDMLALQDLAISGGAP